MISMGRRHMPTRAEGWPANSAGSGILGGQEMPAGGYRCSDLTLSLRDSINEHLIHDLIG
jgi:hypothetical protein